MMNDIDLKAIERELERDDITPQELDRIEAQIALARTRALNEATANIKAMLAELDAMRGASLK